MKTIVTIPTYNEKRNIVVLIPEILKVHPEIEILVIDDNSPDKTYEVVENICKENKKVHLLHRINKKGRGTAGIDGFKKALSLGADLIIEMDADFSHNPKYIPQMIEEAKEYDIVIGSRYIKGGGEKGRSWKRKLITKLANLYIRFVLKLPVLDCTSGFRVFRREVLEKIKLDNLISRGPSIVQEVLYKAYRSGFKIKEIPIIFEERKEGKSTFNLKIMLDGFFKVLLFRIKN